MLLGLHHVTALAGEPQSNLDFYTRCTGMRLVKRTVNFDDPATHHFYFGDTEGTPGTLLTFFPWGFHRKPRRGTGQAVAVAFCVAPAALERWRSSVVRTVRRFGADLRVIVDPDGLDVELVPTEGAPERLHSVTLCENDLEATASLLALLGFERVAEEGNRVRFELPSGAGRVDVLHEPVTEPGSMGAGIVHHVALRVADEAQQLTWRDRLTAAGIRVSPVKDRHYFHSIYFRQPGGTLFEIATDGPGFLIDEPKDSLGQRLCLPPWLEPTRASIESRLAPIHEPIHERL